MGTRKIAIVRGTYFNKFEMQNYEPLADKFEMVGFSGLKPIHDKYSFPIIKLPSPVDLPNFPYKMPILNRLCLGDAMYLAGLEERLKGFDIVHTRETYFHFTNQALNAKKKDYVKKVICTCSETIPFNHEGIWNRKKFKQRAIKEIDVFHCLTKKAKECLIKEGCDAGKIVVFPYGVDLEKFKVMPAQSRACTIKNIGKNEKLKDKNKYINILYVGRLVPEKGIFSLLKNFILLYKTSKNIKLTIVGDGLEKDAIINLINQSKLTKSILIKKVSYQNIVKEYQKADIFILLSKATRYWEEYFGMSLIEAMASGLPIISTKTGAISEVVGKAGILVDPGDDNGIINAMIELINNNQLRKKMAKFAVKRARQCFNSIKVSKNLAKLWNTK